MSKTAPPVEYTAPTDPPQRTPIRAITGHALLKNAFPTNLVT